MLYQVLYKVKRMCEKLLVLARFVSPLYGSSVQLISVDELGWTDNMERVTGVTVLLDNIIRPYIFLLLSSSLLPNPTDNKNCRRLD